MRMQVGNILTPLLPTPAAKSVIYFLIQSRTAITITEIEFLIRPNLAHGMLTYTFQKSQERVMELIFNNTYHFFQAPNSLFGKNFGDLRLILTNFGTCR